MSTPNMSGRTDAPDERPGRDAGDLLDDEGNIDVTRVAEITNVPQHTDTVITPERCGEIRADLLAGDETTKGYAEELGVDHSTVRNHARGRCHHIEERVDVPPVLYNSHTREYEVDR